MNVIGNGVDEVCAGVVGGDVDVAVGVGGETAGEGREKREGVGEGGFKEREEGVGGEVRRGAREEAAFLDVVAGEHWEVGDGEFQGFHSGLLIRENCAFGD